jgi:uncharacterized protein DUF4340
VAAPRVITMRFWKTYVAIAVLAGLIGYAYFFEFKREPTPAGKPKAKVLTFDKAKVQEVTLAAAGSEPVRAVKEAGSWHLAAPAAAPADQNEIESLLSSLEGLEVDETVAENASDLGEYGLKTPKSTVSLTVEGSPQPLQVLIGDKTPDGNAVYAKLPSAPKVFTVPSYATSALEKKPFDLRDRDLLHVKRDAVKSLEVHGPEGDYALARDDKGEWAFTRPVKTRAGRWAVDGLLGTLEGLRMESVAAEKPTDLKPYGLDKPSRTVSLGMSDGSNKTLQIGSSPAEKKYNARETASGLVAVVPGAVVDDLAKGMKELRAGRLLDVSTYEVQGIEMDVDGAHRVYARSSTKDKEGIDVYKWKRTQPDTKDLDTNKVQDALFQVGGLEVKEYLDAPAAPSTYGLDKPVLKVTLTYDSPGKASVWFELGQKGSDLFARRQGDESVLKLDPAKAGELLKAFREL